MNLMKCPNGHHYDASRFSSCPFCGMEGVNVGPDQTTVPLDVPVSQPGPSVATEPLSTAIPVSGFRICRSYLILKTKAFKIEQHSSSESSLTR